MCDHLILQERYEQRNCVAPDCGIDVYACAFQGLFKKMSQPEREQVIYDHNQNLERVTKNKYLFIVHNELGDSVQKMQSILNL